MLMIVHGDCLVSLTKIYAGGFSVHHRFLTLTIVALVLSGSVAFADCGCSSPPVYAPVAASYSSYYAPTVVDYAPASYVSYYAPPAAYVPAPTVSYYAPARSYVTYYSPYVAYSPAVAYAPAVVPYRVSYGALGWSIYGAPRVYVPGEPVRNTVKALTP